MSNGRRQNTAADWRHNIDLAHAERNRLDWSAAPKALEGPEDSYVDQAWGALEQFANSPAVAPYVAPYMPPTTRPLTTPVGVATSTPAPSTTTPPIGMVQTPAAPSLPPMIANPIAAAGQTFGAAAGQAASSQALGGTSGWPWWAKIGAGIAVIGGVWSGASWYASRRASGR